jgi:hypothetical protein
MITVTNQKTMIRRNGHQSSESDSAHRSSVFIRRRARLNPVIVIAAFSTALFYDAISSAAAQTALHSIWRDLLAVHKAYYPAGAIAFALVLAFTICLLFGAVIARFACSSDKRPAAKG